MEDIKQEKLDNEGGIEKVYFAPLEYFNYFGEPIDNVLTENITFKTGYDWHKVDAVRGTVLYEEEEEVKNGSEFYKPKLTLAVSRYTTAIARSTYVLNNYPLVFLIKANNGEFLLIGSKDEGIQKLKRKVTTGAVPGELNHALLEFGADGMRNPAVHYTGAV